MMPMLLLMNNNVPMPMREQTTYTFTIPNVATIDASRRRRPSMVREFERPWWFNKSNEPPLASNLVCPCMRATLREPCERMSAR